MPLGQEIELTQWRSVKAGSSTKDLSIEASSSVWQLLVKNSIRQPPIEEIKKIPNVK
jgi:hypothetical protein